MRLTARLPECRPLRAAFLLGALSLAASVPASAADRAPEPASPSDAPIAATTQPAAPADPLDLGRGLRYCRLANHPDAAAVVEAAVAAPALVLDLRLARANDEQHALLQALLAGRDAARPALILLGPDTPVALRDRVPTTTGIITLAGAQAGVAPRLPITVDPTQDHLAAEALAAGRPPRELYETKIEKARFDEAHLALNHANGNRSADAPRDPAEPAAADDASVKAKPEPPQDILLQRAVFLHRALLALGRIPDQT